MAIAVQVFCGNKYGVNLLELEETLESEIVRFLGERSKDPYAREVVFADDTQSAVPPLERILQSLQSADFFGGGDKAIVIKNFDAMNDEDAAELVRFIKSENSGNALFIEALKFYRANNGKPKFRGTGVDFDYLKKNAQIREFKEIPEWEVHDWVRKRAAKYGFNLSVDNAHFFVDTVGIDTQTIDAEFKKLQIYAGAQKDLSWEILDQSLSRTGEATFAELQKCFGLAQRDAFLSQLDRIASDRSDWMGTLISLFYHSSTLLRIRELKAQQMSNDEIAKTIGVHPFKFNKGMYLQQSQSRSLAAWKKILIRLGESCGDIIQGHLNLRSDLELRLLSLFPLSRS